MSEEVMIQSIKIQFDRPPWSADRIHDYEALAKDIKKNGLKLPILIDRDNNLIDGARRIAAFERLGWASIPAVVATTYEEAMNYLERIYGPTNPITDWRRAWEIYKATHLLLQARLTRLRAKYAGVPQAKRGTVPKEPRSRNLFNQAMGTIYVTKGAELYRAAEEGVTGAEALVKRLEAGEFTVNAALHRLHGRSIRLSGNVISADEQAHLLAESVRSLSGLVKGLRKLDKKIVVPAREFEPLIAELRKHRGDLVGLIRQIQKGYNTK